MLSSAPRLTLPLLVSLSLVLATLVEANDFNAYKRDHTGINMNRRIIKKRQLDIFGPVAAGAQDDPTVSSSSSVASSSVSPSTSASVSATSSASSTETSASSTGSSTSASSTASSSSTPSVASTPTSVAPAAPTSETLNLSVVPTAPSNIVSTVVPTFILTRTESGQNAQQTTIPDIQHNAQKEGGNILTIIIGIAASLGGIAIIWTVFRKWKLSSSKKFDQRLNPIDFQPTVPEHDIVPSHRRIPSNGSSRSGHRAMNASDRALEQHDLTAGPTASNVGGYADLSRGPSPTQMSEQLTRGPSLNRDYDYGVPLHHQGGYGNPSYRY